jgi:hypothetical protein
MNDEINWMWKEVVWPTLKYYPRLSGELQKTIKNSNQGSRFLGWEFNMKPPKCEALNMALRTGGSQLNH